MEPTRDRDATLVDLLDRVLDKGMILDADLIIYVAGVPLVGVKLSAAIAGVEVMRKYGFLQGFEEVQAPAEKARSPVAVASIDQSR